MKEDEVIVKVNPAKNNAIANFDERGKDDNGFFLDGNGTYQLSLS
jgi:hypothetical protein